jgi:predicted DNA-binding transcriptional regulator YafY
MAKGDYGKRNFFIRYFSVIKCLRNKRRGTFDEIRDYIARETGIMDKEFIYEIRTFQRDINDIRSIFNINIKCDRRVGEYFIADDDNESFNSRMLESFDIFSSLSSADHLAEFVALDRKCPQGTEHLYGCLHAIRNRFKISVKYQKFYEDMPEIWDLSPIALKEFKGRWYLVAIAQKREGMRHFALDRMQELEISNEKFKRPAGFDLHEYFKDCFGIMRPVDQEPEKVILSFEPFQGNYIKSYPLHGSQEIIADNEDETRISLKLHITEDFIIELFSYSDKVEVLEPKHLKESMKKACKNMLK